MTTRTVQGQAGPAAVLVVRRGKARGRAGVLALVLALLACYGTLTLIAALSVMGIALSPDQIVLKSIIVACALAATASIGFGSRRHGSPLPLALAAGGAALLATLMIVGVDRALELLAFALLIIAVVLDSRLRARVCRAAKERNDG